MEVADYLDGAGTWLHCSPEHHQVALVDAGRAHFHHFALDYYDWGTLRSLFDGLAQHGRWLSWGPVRHGIGQNICGYVRITEEPLHVECYVDMELLEDEHEPRHWPDDRFSSNTWGPCRPARTSVSTPPPSSPNARAARPAASRSRPCRRSETWRRRSPPPAPVPASSSWTGWPATRARSG